MSHYPIIFVGTLGSAQLQTGQGVVNSSELNQVRDELAEHKRVLRRLCISMNDKDYQFFQSRGDNLLGFVHGRPDENYPHWYWPELGERGQRSGLTRFDAIGEDKITKKLVERIPLDD